MNLANPEAFILFSLGKFHEQANKSLEGKPLKASMSKAAFIELAKQAGIAQKTERALYKNLEALEKRKLIAYNHKTLALTPKGHQEFRKILNTIYPYFASSQILSHVNVKTKTVLST